MAHWPNRAGRTERAGVRGARRSALGRRAVGCNPFFVGEILRGLWEAEALIFDEDSGRWSVDRSDAGAPTTRLVWTSTCFALRRGGGALRVDQDLRVGLGISERLEGPVDAVESHGASDKRTGVHLSLGEHVKRVAELEGGVTEDEAQL